MRKILSVFLCVSMLLTSLMLFSSCKKEYTGEPDVSKKVIDVDLTDYCLVFSGELSNASQTEIRTFTESFRPIIGKNMRANKDTANPVQKEILIGNVDRAETREALSDLKGNGWIIRVYDNKIVIAGTTHLFTKMAMNYFVEKYLSGNANNGKVLSVNKKVVLDKAPIVTLASDDSYHYSFVYSAKLDATEGSGGYTASVDYPVTVYKNLDSALRKVAKAKASTLSSKTDAVEESENEILVGKVDREECRATLNAMAANQYGLVVSGSKVLVAAWTDEALALAQELFVAAVNDSAIKNEDGTVTLAFPANYADVRTLPTEEANWVTEFPKPETDGLTLVDTTYVSEDSLVYAYQGEGVSANAFNAYCQKLVNNGYTLLQSNQIVNNLFATYVNTEEKITLHVQLELFEYAIEQGYDDMYKPTLRIVSAPTASVNLPTEELLNANAYRSINKITDSMITAVKINYSTGNFGMCYVITLEDGSFILFDGGGGADENRELATEALVDDLNVILEDLVKKTTGKEVSSSNPIHIRAWVLTHEHVDHYGAMKGFFEQYGATGSTIVDYVIANFTSDKQCYNSVNPSHVMRDNMVALSNMVKDGDGLKYIKVHTGQKLYIQNAEIEVLFTHDAHAPNRLTYYNDSSTVLRFTLHNTDPLTGAINPGADSTSIWTGDAYRFAGRYMCAMYGSYLQSDMVQLAHHGGNGLEKEFYDLIDATVVWYPHSSTSYWKPNQSTWYGQATHFMLMEEASVEYIYVSTGYNITLTLTKDGPDYENLYNAGDAVDKTIPYDTIQVIKAKDVRN